MFKSKFKRGKVLKSTLKTINNNAISFGILYKETKNRN
jgi:hypothetical protein